MSADKNINWFVLRVRPVTNIEFEVMHAINQREIQAMVPSKEEWVKRAKRRYRVRKPWFSCHVFVCLRNQEEGHWLKRSINQVADDMGRPRPVVGLLGYNAERAAALSEADVAFLKELTEHGMPRVDLRTLPTFTPGKKLKVTEGPFAGFGGVVDSVTRDRVKALIEIFGRWTPVEFEYDGAKAAGIKAA